MASTNQIPQNLFKEALFTQTQKCWIGMFLRPKTSNLSFLDWEKYKVKIGKLAGEVERKDKLIESLSNTVNVCESRV